jgi:diguanylate cyclase (GGDEF)-like protein
MYLQYLKVLSAKYPKSTVAIICLIALVLLTGIIRLLAIDNIINSFELKTLDWRYVETQTPEKHDDRIVLVVFDDISKQRAESDPDLKLSNTILPDDTTARVINYLADSGAEYIVFNSKFEGARLEESSLNFIESIKNAGNVFFPVAFSNSDYILIEELKKKDKRRITKNPKISLSILEILKSNLMNQNSEQLKNALKNFKLEIINEDLFSTFPYHNLLSYNTFGPIYFQVLKNCRGIGAVNVRVSNDGVLRNLTPVFYYNKNFYPSLALAVARAVMGEDDTILKFNNDGHLLLGDKIIPLNNEGEFLIKWFGPTGTYQHYKMSDIVKSDILVEKGEKPIITPDRLKNKIILIGETHAGSNVLTFPLSKAVSGVELQANMLDNFLNVKNYIQPVNPSINFIIALFAGILVSLFVLRLKNGLTVVVSFAGIIIFYLLAAKYIFSLFNLWIEVVYPLGFITVVFITTFLVKYNILSKAYEDAFQLAIKDGLTGLYNHKYFQETLDRDLLKAIRHKENMALLMIDIDYFKKFNDTFGHRAGDAILKQVAGTLKKNVRTSDLVARYGGEEMSIILYNANFENGKMVANKLLKSIDELVFIYGDKTHKNITVSIGLANYPEHSDSAQNLIEMADKGLYKAKNNGRNQVCWLEPVNTPHQDLVAEPNK